MPIPVFDPRRRARGGARPSRASPQSASSRAPRPVVAAPPPPTAPVEPAAVVRDATLEEERILLETARAALARDRVDGALAATDTHARRFPQGQLAEERQALAVQALVAAGRQADAQARTNAFHAAFPDSLLGPAVDAALRSASGSSDISGPFSRRCDFVTERPTPTQLLGRRGRVPPPGALS